MRRQSIGNLQQKRVPCALSFGDITRNFREAAEIASTIVQRGNHHAGPESRAVLADSPALVLHAPLRGRDFQLFLRLAGLDIFGGIETPEMLSDNLVSFVALDLFRAGVPARHAAPRIEHEYAVVVDLIHQQTKALFAHPQRFLGLLAVGHVANGSRKKGLVAFLKRA